MSKNLHYWYEFASPYSYLSAMRIGDVAKERGVKVIWRPFLLGGIYKMLELPIPPMQLNPMKEEYMWLDCARQARGHGIPFHKPDRFPQVAVLPARVALIGFEEGWGEAFSIEVYRANFVHNQLISDVDVITQILEQMGHGPEDVLARATTPENKKALMDETQKAFDKKIFGVPTFFVGDEIFWGDDRLELALERAVNG
jgi:2-hydroxychromene-2-carboxylate isomerase